MKFLECSIPNPKYRYELHKNKVINLSKVISFKKSTLNWYPDNIGIPSIVFWFSEKCSEEWAYNSEQERDLDYNKILKGDL